MCIPLAPATLLDDRLLAGFAAREAGKSLYCAVRARIGETHIVRCVLAGARQPIPNGAIALLKLKIATHAPVGSTRVRVERGLAYPRIGNTSRYARSKQTVAIRGQKKLSGSGSQFGCALSSPKRQFRSVGDAQFAENMKHVLLHRAHSQAKLVSNLFVTFGLLDESNNLLFAKRQPRRGPSAIGGNLFTVSAGILTAECAKSSSAAGARLWNQYFG